jgi:RNA polymerase sigma factor (sigma-70 family)
MASGPLHAVLHHLHRVVAASPAGAISDRQLLHRFARRHDEDAFAVLVRRHGDMVLGVCRRVLHDSHAAEDVFQATFLVLARTATSGRWHDSVGPWLHEVAYRLAVKARSGATRRLAVESNWEPTASREHLPEAERHELRTIVDEEVGRLPDRYRLPVVLCYLEGRTNAEAAEQLGWSKTTLRGRLARARDVLRARLTRRGLALPGATVLAGLAAGELSAAVPATLTASTVRLAALLAAPEAGALTQVSGRIAALADGMTRALFVSKVKTAALVLLMVGLLAAGAGFLAHQALAEKPAEERQADTPPAPAATGDNPRGVDEGRLDPFGDPLPAGALSRLGTNRLRHGGLIDLLAFAPDGKTLASAGLDGFIHIWDATTGKELRRISNVSSPDHVGGDYVRSLAFAPDGKTLAGAGLNSPTCLWNAATGEEIHRFGGYQHRAGWALFSPDGKMLAYGGGWNLAGDDPVICLADAARGQELQRFVGHEGKVDRVAFSAEGKALVSSGHDGTIRLWDVATGKELHRWGGERFALSPDGKVLAFSAKDRVIHLSDTTTGKELRQWEGALGEFQSLLFSPDGRILAVAGYANKWLGAWDVATGKALLAAPLGGKREEVNCILFASSGPTLLSGHADGSVRVWDLTMESPARRFQAHEEGVLRMALSPDGRTLASTSATYFNGESVVRLWEVATGKPLVQHVGPQRAIGFVAFSADSKLVATSSGEPALHLWEAASGKHLHTMTANGPLAFTLDSKTLLSGGWSDGKIHFWDTASGTETRQFQAHPRSLAGLALTPDGKTLVTVGGDSFLRLWDLAREKELHDFGGKQTSAILRIALSPDGKLLVSAHQDHSIAVWDVVTGKLLRRLHDTAYIASVAISPDSKLLASTTNQEPVVRLWDVTTGEVIRRLTLAPVPDPKSGQLGFNGAPWDVVAFSPDGRTVLGGGQHFKVIHCWEVSTGKQRCRFQGHQGHVVCLAFSPDGTMLVSGGSDASALVWDVTGRLERERTPAPALTDAQLDALWTDLAGVEADVVYQAMCRLRQSPREAVALLRKQVPPVPIADAQRLSAWLRDLDSNQFAIREKAKQELEKLGEAAEPALRKALEAQPSAEVRQRVTQLLERLDGQEQLRQSRALEVLEWIGNQETLKTLRTLAEGAPEAVLTQQAKRSLVRLARRPEKP